ncbi:MAG: DNA-binding protein [Bacillota bacterium]
MTRIRTLTAVLAACLLISMPGFGPMHASGLQPGTAPHLMPIGELVNRAREMDGLVVRLVGEAVGDLMVRGDHAWVNILDASGTAIGVFLPKEEALKVKSLGKYRQKGDVVDLIGVFHNSCDVHDGEPDVHADSIAVVENGHSVSYPVEVSRMVLGGILLVLAGALGLAVRRRAISPPR